MDKLIQNILADTHEKVSDIKLHVKDILRAGVIHDCRLQHRAINRPAISQTPLKRADISGLQPASAYSPEIYFGATVSRELHPSA
jgi:hypothetical protein